MSEYTREEMLKMIEENGGPKDLDLSEKDLSGIDLGSEAISKELEKYRKNNPDEIPAWFSRMKGGIDLRGAILKKTDLEKASLQGADLTEAHLDEAKLVGAHLERATLRVAHLEEASLGGAHMEEAALWGAKLQGAYLGWAHLEGVDLRWGHLEEANLEKAQLERAFLWEAHLERASLREAHLEKVDLSVAKSLAGVYFYRAWLDQTRMTKEQLGGRIGEELDKEYYEAKEAYLLLKNNFNQIGRYDDASWVYVKERQMEKMTYHPKLARKHYAKTEGFQERASPKSWARCCFYVKYTLKWLWDWTIEGLCGYGERPLNVVAVALSVLTIVFPFLYLVTGLTTRSAQNLLWRDYFLYSLYAFGSMEHPTLQATSRIAQFFTGLESLSGIALLALLMYTLGRRISRS